MLLDGRRSNIQEAELSGAKPDVWQLATLIVGSTSAICQAGSGFDSFEILNFSFFLLKFTIDEALQVLFC